MEPLFFIIGVGGDRYVSSDKSRNLKFVPTSLRDYLDTTDYLISILHCLTFRKCIINISTVWFHYYEFIILIELDLAACFYLLAYFKKGKCFLYWRKLTKQIGSLKKIAYHKSVKSINLLVAFIFFFCDFY